MPVYNSEKYLRPAIDSILGQSFQDFEFIIIDDGSTDSTSNILKSYTDNRIKIINHSYNLGIVKSLNEGLKISRGAYIARMDADDVSMPERLAEQYSYIHSNPEVVVCGANIQSINSAGKITSGAWWKKDDGQLDWELIWGNVLPHPTVLIRKEALQSDLYRNYKFAEDYDLWLRMLNKGKIVRMDKVLLLYRIHSDHSGDSSLSLEEAYRSNLYWLKNSLALEPPLEHRWLSNFSQYGEDFGDISFEQALYWMKNIASATNQSVNDKQMLKVIMSACDKLVFAKKVQLIKKSLKSLNFYFAFLILFQTAKQYTRMMLRIK